MSFDKNQIIKIFTVTAILLVLLSSGAYVAKQFHTIEDNHKKTPDVAGAKTESVETISPTPELTPTPTIEVEESALYKKVPRAALAIDPTQEPIPTQFAVQQPTIYRVLTLPELVNMNGANSQSIQAAQRAYNIFLQTQNLVSMSPQRQIEFFTPILEAEIKKDLDAYKQQLQNQIDWYDQQSSNLQPLSPTTNQANSAYESCVDSKVASINSNPYLSESIRLSRIDMAKQDCEN